MYPVFVIQVLSVVYETGTILPKEVKPVGLASSTISDWKTKKTNPSADKIM